MNVRAHLFIALGAAVLVAAYVTGYTRAWPIRRPHTPLVSHSEEMPAANTAHGPMRDREPRPVTVDSERAAELSDAPIQFFPESLSPNSHDLPVTAVDREERAALIFSSARKPAPREADTQDSPQTDRAPEPLTLPSDAVPLSGANEAHEAAVRATIKRELGSVSPDEQEIWFSELKSFSPEMIEELLRLRRKLDVRPDASPSVVPPIDPIPGQRRRQQQAQGPLSLRNETTSRIPAGKLAETERTLAALRQARNVALQNIANAQAVGFQRSRVLFAPAWSPLSDDLPRHGALTTTADQVAAPQGALTGVEASLISTQLDCSQGSIRRTGRSLDLAIDGDGFFRVQVGEEILYSRAGVLTLNAAGELALRLSNTSRPLSPPLRVDPDVVEIRASADGVVSTYNGASQDATEIGRITLTRFVNPAELERRGHGLLAATAASGKPVDGDPGVNGFGSLVSGHLEESNVAMASEIAILRKLDQQIELLAAAKSAER